MCRGACVHPPSRPYEQTVRKKPRTQIYANKGSMAIARKQSRYGQKSAKQKELSTSTKSTSLHLAICEHEGSAGVWILANLVSPRSVMVHLPWKHVERLAILSADNRFRLAACSLQPTGCARGECRSPAPRGWRRCVHAALPVSGSGKVPRFRAGADSLLLSVYGPRRSVSDFWWDLCPTAWSAVGSTLHLQQPDWQAAALRMVPRASGSALWALCYVPHTSLFSLCIAFWTIKEHRTHIGELATASASH